VLEIASPCFSKKDKGHLKAQLITKQIADECLEMWQQKQPGRKGKSKPIEELPLQQVPPLQPFIQTSIVEQQDFIDVGQDFIDVEPEEEIKDDLEQDFIDNEVDTEEVKASLSRKSKPSFITYIGMVLIGIIITLVVLYILIYYIV
jgi:hypothetical protein